RIKAMNQHLIRLETDYSNDISNSTIKKFFKIIESRSQDFGAIIILDYGIGGLFEDLFIQKLLIKLNENYKNIPVIARPNLSNYYIYENIDLIKINLQKALKTLSIDCCNETSISIAGKKILNATNCKNVFLNYIESDSYLYFKENEKVEKFAPVLQTPVRSYVAVGSVIMALLGLAFASNIFISEAIRLALFAAALTASLPPVEFYDTEKLYQFILTHTNNK
ncbi:MAG: hypothetical protein ACFFAN_09035, partial [Promethearchaeota archaeon]